MGLYELFEFDGNCIITKTLCYVALLVGVSKLTIMSLGFFSMILNLFVLPAVNFKKYGSSINSWAVVTGASDGIGKEFALQLAKKGFNIILISRTESKLELIQTEIETKYKVKTKKLAIDISKNSKENYDKIREICYLNLPISILVNNVGQSHSIPVPFLETDINELNDIITINNIATLKITQIIAPIIVETTKSKKIKGLILNMGSFAGLIPTPYLATYSGSKAFLEAWSDALAGELASSNIDVELIISYLVASAMSKIKRPSATIPNPKDFVSSVLKNVGRSRCGAQERFATITPYWSHALMHWFIVNTVGTYSSIANKLNANMHKSIRSRALKKAKRLADQTAKQD
ncbi:hypothetical protein PACTADRAFT_62235 [Pachysolen tannophilus NRRL Y-2460]|uniref:Very-long-chain 3-oxoacyl-CoA reductase n=1 Tax=Pachysolen tannophilus NRRL Y-2460 TaxID=669874 RepID=A0A1E4TNR3_PACTA|nr:hypothetical protein PACTADRAFT_62235 [Pachysolen tannophilus NRRL Y-2460]